MSDSMQVKYRKDYHCPEFTITDIQLDIQLDPTLTIVKAKSTVVQKKCGMTDFTLIGENLTLRSVAINGKAWSAYTEEEGKLILHHVPPKFILTIENEIEPIKNTALEGLYVSGDALCTQCEAEGFRRITYYLDRPDVLAKFKTRLTANKEKYPFLLSNGNRIASGDLDDGRHWVQWEDPFPKPSYLFALVAGEFDVLHDAFVTRSGREVALELYVDRGNLDRASWAMTSLKHAMKWDEARFGLEYDLDIYMIVAVDFFNMGAMENKGLNIFNSKFVLANPATATDKDYLNIESVIGHEYFHNWTGNRVTCRDWFQLSLKEGLTVFRDQEFSSDLGSRAVNRIENVAVMRSAQFAEDASPMSHPIRPDKVIEMNNFYTLTVYEKGAEVIRMMHMLLGETLFQKGMKLYIARHDGSAATCDDFVAAMEDASEIDLTQFRRWYSQSGTPIVSVTDVYDENTKTYSLTIKQFTPPTVDQSKKDALHIPFDIALYDENGTILPLQYQGETIHHVLNVTKNEQTFVFDHIPNKPTPALLQDFSAPVKLEYDFSDEQLIFLMTYCQNAFSKYDAAQNLLKKYITHFVRNANVECVLPDAVIAAFRAILLGNEKDLALVAKIMAFPTENEMAEWFDIIEPARIHAVKMQLLQQIADALYDVFLSLYQQHRKTDYHVTQEDIAARALGNLCLFYLAHSKAQRISSNELVLQHYKNANNMTNVMAALVAANSADLICRETILADFDEKWHQDGLVMDKWFALQATHVSSSTLDNVKALLSHRSFNFNNPNRVRALIGSFVSLNPVDFHAADGSGYQFLEDVLTKLNETNPQVASRLIEPLIRFKRYPKASQEKMEKVLQHLQMLPDLSRDLYEKITKALDVE